MQCQEGRPSAGREAGAAAAPPGQPVFGCAPQAAAQHKGSYCQGLIQGLHSFSNMALAGGHGRATSGIHSGLAAAQTRPSKQEPGNNGQHGMNNC
ncbi:hypothetical protein EYF80_020572 [Liparis tanakae]|uniref:Uncharacterized protein n=1 Tax=Liparis tanakae TaxID=230148 RepID=A0A4Z2HVD0_9TELE|nr:hypothetical protein EYF80_020572 [Liparis tanakae]